MEEAHHLSQHLDPLREILDDSDISEISINRPGEVYIEKNGGTYSKRCDFLTEDYLYTFAVLLGNLNKKPINRESPHFSGVIPGGHRIQMVVPPATPDGLVAVSIRKSILRSMSISDLKARGLFDELDDSASEQLTDAVLAKKNIIISGGTSTGKTTLMNSLINEIPESERLAVLEDTREINSLHPNKFYLLANGESETSNSMMQNLKSALRLRPDRILVGEVRGGEAAVLLEALATGHDGSICTLHATSPKVALQRLAIMAERGGMKQQTRKELMEYIYTIVDVVIQIKRDTGGRRYVSEIYFL